MKKIINFFITLAYGIIPAIAGGAIALDVYWIVRHIQMITTGSGWTVVYHFALGIIELLLAITLLYDLGSLNMFAVNWKKHLKNNTSDSTCDNTNGDQESETSDKHN